MGNNFTSSQTHIQAVSGVAWWFRNAKAFQVFCLFTVVLMLFALPESTKGQAVTMSYSYENLTRNNGGGTLEKGDIIEVHALMLVKNKTANNVYYIDTIRNGAKFVSGSLKIVTNEGLTYYGPYTDGSNDDEGVYDDSYGGVSRVRVNIGANPGKARSGSNLTSTSGGGSIVPGTYKPKFYGGTLLMVAYQLEVTANFGDTLYLTGNYYFDTSGTLRSYHFAYPGIKVIKNSGLCENFSSASFTADSSFGSGNVQDRVTPAIVPGYNKVTFSANQPQDGNYSIANNTSPTQKTVNTGPPTGNPDRVFGVWDIIGDHTGSTDPNTGNQPTAQNATGGYMLVVNAAFSTGEAFRQTISGLCPNTNYEFSAWVRNICGYCGINANSVSTNQPGVLPNLTFAVNDIDYYTSGDIPWDGNWKKRGFMYKTGPDETSFTISIRNNAAGGGGNDWVLDDIKLVTCYPNLIMNPSDTASACAGWPITLSDTVKSYFNNYTHYRWETSDDGVNWVPANAGGTRTPTVINGLFVYYVDTVINPSKADSGTYFRVKVATTSDNLNDDKCAVDKSQRIFLKVYSTACPLLDVTILNFYGSLSNNKTALQWSAQNEGELQKYIVQKSSDGIHFADIGEETAKNGIGSKNYNFNDPNEIFNTAYYRLKLLNSTNNEIKYSKIISLFNKNTPFKISTVNPFSNSVKMDVFVPSQGNIEFSLCDMYGHIVKNKTTTLNRGNSNVSIEDVSSLPPGLYILRALFNGAVIQYKLVKIN